MQGVRPPRCAPARPPRPLCWASPLRRRTLCDGGLRRRTRECEAEPALRGWIGKMACQENTAAAGTAGAPARSGEPQPSSCCPSWCKRTAARKQAAGHGEGCNRRWLAEGLLRPLHKVARHRPGQHSGTPTGASTDPPRWRRAARSPAAPWVNKRKGGRVGGRCWSCPARSARAWGGRHMHRCATCVVHRRGARLTGAPRNRCLALRRRFLGAPRDRGDPSNCLRRQAPARAFRGRGGPSPTPSPAGRAR
jgi:hypothetical protein